MEDLTCKNAASGKFYTFSMSEIRKIPLNTIFLSAFKMTRIMRNSPLPPLPAYGNQVKFWMPTSHFQKSITFFLAWILVFLSGLNTLLFCFGRTCPRVRPKPGSPITRNQEVLKVQKQVLKLKSMTTFNFIWGISCLGEQNHTQNDSTWS